MNIPNVITLARILSVPLIVWAIASGEMGLAFGLFFVAGVSDAVDGFIAKRFGMTSELGAYLDPLADKALLVSIFVTLGVVGVVPRWLVIMAVSRDIIIIGGVMLAWVLGKPIAMRPLLVSKLNTAAQIAFAALVLATLGIGFEAAPLRTALMGLVAVLTPLSTAFYMRDWLRHMNAA